MPVQVQGPDGLQYQFPDGTDKQAAIAYFKKKGIGASAKPTDSIGPWKPTARERFMNPDLYPVGEPGEGVGENLKNVVQRGGVGIFQLADAILNPGRTVRAMAGTVLPDPVIRLLNKSPDAQGREIPVGEPNPIESAYQAVAPGGWKAVGNVAPTAGQALAGGAFGEFAGEALPPILRKGSEALNKTKEGVRTTAQSLTGAGGRAIKNEVLKAGDEALKSDTAHAEATQDALHETQGRELKNKQDTQAAKDAADRESKEQTAKQIEERNRAIEQRRAAEQKLAAEKAKQGKISPTQAKVETAWSNLRAGVETARENALATGNSKYSGVNEKLSALPADMEKIQGLYSEAAESIGEVQSEPGIITRLGKAIERGEALTYKDEQALYSELGNELSKGTLPGPTYHAYDLMHDAIGEDMQRIADSQGQGAALTDARNYWRRMKQTFGKKLSLSDAATTTVKQAAPDVAEQADFANRIRLIGSFDPRIPGLFDHVQNLKKGLESLPEPTPNRVLTEKAKLPAIPPRGRPVTVEPKPVAPAERVPIPDRPAVTELNTRLARERLVDKWASGESSLNKWQVRALLTGGLSAAFDLAELLGGRAPGLGTMAAEAAGTAAYTFGPAAVAKLLENAKFREWITRPPAGELETLSKLPNADRITITDGLNKAVAQAQRQGIKVSPALLSYLAGATKSAPRRQSGPLAQSPIQ